jgi:Arc/MetJ-type ribon-helix-helix transcriptional regulator
MGGGLLMVRLVTLTGKVPESYVKLLDSLVKAGLYTSRSDALRAALREFIRKHYSDPEVLKLQLQLTRQAGGDGRG